MDYCLRQLLFYALCTGRPSRPTTNYGYSFDHMHASQSHKKLMGRSVEETEITRIDIDEI